ncbi:protein transport protein SEC13 [Pancytospora epiphaga]|nr:protein transport protein SEC13 [Pancytospora epiphaga]
MDKTEAIVHSMDTDISEKHMVAGCSDGIVRIYNIGEDNKLNSLAELQGHKSAVTKAVFTHHGEFIVSADFSGKVLVWKIENGIFIRKIERQLLDGPIYDIAVRYDKEHIHIFCGCSGGDLKTLHVDPSMNCEEESKEVHRYGVLGVSCNDEYVVTSGFDFSIILHGKDTTKTFNNHQAAVTGVAVAPTNHIGKLVFASCSEDGTLAVVEGKEDNFTTEIIEVGEACLSVGWNRTGLVLTVGLESGAFKNYILGKTGKYEELETADYIE